MNPSLVKALLDARTEGVQLLYGVATGPNTVLVGQSTVAVELPALEPVSAGAYVAILASGADRLILGQVGHSVGFRHETIGSTTAISAAGVVCATTPSLTFSSTRRYKATYGVRAVDASTTDAGLNSILRRAGVGIDAGVWTAVPSAGLGGGFSTVFLFVGTDTAQTWTLRCLHQGHSFANPQVYTPRIMFEDIGPA